MKHLTFGGSSAYRWLRCAGSSALLATLPPQAANEYMQAGTRAHKLLEVAVSERRESVYDMEGVSIQEGWPAFIQDDVEAVQVALDYVNELLDKDPQHLLFVERQVVLSDDVGGTCDVMIYHPSTETLHVLDYKHGMRYVEAEGNPQLKLYAAAALFGFAEANVKAIHATIVQPRCFNGLPIRTAMYGPADLIVYSDEVDAAVAAARQPNAPLTPGKEQCHWCPAAHVCPALVGAGVALLPTEGSHTILHLPAPEECTDPFKLAQTLEAICMLKLWIDGVEAQARSVALAGTALPGYKLVEKIARRAWADPAAAKEWIEQNTMLDADQYAPRKLAGIPAIEKLMNAEGGTEAVKKLAALVDKQSSGLNLVPVTAKGEPVNPLELVALGFAASVTI